jgi:pimeloyl-ACP methyl ester carboxylesterase
MSTILQNRYVLAVHNLLVLLILIISVSIAGSPSGALAPPYPAPGQLIDLGGWRLHINCTGEPVRGQPTVVLEAGAGDFSVEWSLVQPAVARFARVCSYDRAGSGWSELGPRPRTMAQIVWELRALLDKAGAAPPYVLVGHSFGGVLVQLYASTYPSHVAGVVLIESGSLNPLRFVNGKLTRPAESATGAAIPAVKTSGPLRETDIPPRVLSMMEAAARDSGPHANDSPRDKLPREAQRMRTWALSQVKTYAANDNPFEGEELARMRTDQIKNAPAFGEIPLVVLVRGRPEDQGPGAQAMEDEHRREQVASAGLSRKGRYIVADRSGHHVQLDQPDLVVTAIRDVIGAR